MRRLSRQQSHPQSPSTCWEPPVESGRIIGERWLRWHFPRPARTPTTARPGMQTTTGSLRGLAGPRGAARASARRPQQLVAFTGFRRANAVDRATAPSSRSLNAAVSRLARKNGNKVLRVTRMMFERWVSRGAGWAGGEPASQPLGLQPGHWRPCPPALGLGRPREPPTPPAGSRRRPSRSSCWHRRRRAGWVTTLWALSRSCWASSASPPVRGAPAGLSQRAGARGARDADAPPRQAPPARRCERRSSSPAAEYRSKTTRTVTEALPAPAAQGSWRPGRGQPAQ